MKKKRKACANNARFSFYFPWIQSSCTHFGDTQLRHLTRTYVLLLYEYLKGRPFPGVEGFSLRFSDGSRGFIEREPFLLCNFHVGRRSPPNHPLSHYTRSNYMPLLWTWIKFIGSDLYFSIFFQFQSNKFIDYLFSWLFSKKLNNFHWIVSFYIFINYDCIIRYIRVICTYVCKYYKACLDG